MALRQSYHLQFRLITCHLAGVVGGFAVMPQLLAWGLDMQNVVLSSILGGVLFLTLATAAGLIWRRWILERPLRWAIANPALLPLAIYLLLRSLTGFEPREAPLALETSLVGGLCALISSIFFLMWTCLARNAASHS